MLHLHLSSTLPWNFPAAKTEMFGNAARPVLVLKLWSCLEVWTGKTETFGNDGVVTRIRCRIGSYYIECNKYLDAKWHNGTTGCSQAFNWGTFLVLLPGRVSEWSQHTAYSFMFIRHSGSQPFRVATHQNNQAGACDRDVRETFSSEMQNDTNDFVFLWGKRKATGPSLRIHVGSNKKEKSELETYS